MIKQLKLLEPFIGNTLIKPIQIDSLDVYAKLEYTNFSGSIKDRAAYNVLYEGIMSGEINEETTIIESSSGNFAIALSSICNFLGLKFVAVIDPNINPLYEKRIGLVAHDVIKVDTVDETGGYLLNRINCVEKYCEERSNVFWTNQYENPNNYLAYYGGLGNEICSYFDSLEYLFVAVSSCGTVTGLSRKLKEKFTNLKVIAVDVEGSVIFSDNPSKRHVSGIGASKRPSILDRALVDDVVIVSEIDIAKASNALLKEQSLFAGASTGAIYWAIKNYFKNTTKNNQKVLFLCHDSGYAYMDSIYNTKWIDAVLNKDEMAVKTF